MINCEQKTHKFVNDNGNAILLNTVTDKTIKLVTDSTIIINKNLDLEIMETSITEIKYLESLMMEADEKMTHPLNIITEAENIERTTNVVVIKLRNEWDLVGI